MLNSHWLRNCSSSRSWCWFKVGGIAPSWGWQCTKRNFHVVKNLPPCLILALFPTGLLRKNEPSSHSSGAFFALWMNILGVQIKCSTAAICFLSLTGRTGAASRSWKQVFTAKPPCQLRVPLLLLPFFCDTTATRPHQRGAGPQPHLHSSNTCLTLRKFSHEDPDPTFLNGRERRHRQSQTGHRINIGEEYLNIIAMQV